MLMKCPSKYNEQSHSLAEATAATLPEPETVDIAYIGEWTWAASFGRLLWPWPLEPAWPPPSAMPSPCDMVLTPAGNTWDVGDSACTRPASFGAIALLYLLIFCHRYEFEYVWKHLNDAMPFGFMLSSFWGGQEGGFLIWMSWMLVLALVFLRRNPGRLEAPVMAVHGGVLTGLSSMLLGLYFGDFQFGLDPFLLLREAPQNAGLPWTFNPDYLALIPQFADGQGLNPLLQNYWMVIHPPPYSSGLPAR